MGILRWVISGLDRLVSSLDGRLCRSLAIVGDRPVTKLPAWAAAREDPFTPSESRLVPAA